MYTKVNIIKIKACNKITKMWKIAHAAPAITCPTRPRRLGSTLKVQILPRRAINMNINSPAYIFPKSRIPKETVLATYSIKFNNKLKGAKYHFAQKGADINSCAKPPTPLIFIL